MLNKKEIRKEIQKIRSELSKEVVSRNSEIIKEKLFNMEEYKNSEIIFIYMSFNGEVETKEIIEDSLSKNKKVAIPKIINGEMEFYYINNINDVETGYFGVQEPIKIEKPVYLKESKNNTLIVIPGVAFDFKKHRIGYGKGFYDMYLSKYQYMNKEEYHHIKIALAFDFQVLEKIPYDSYDILPDMIITEKEIIL